MTLSRLSICVLLFALWSCSNQITMPSSRASGFADALRLDRTKALKNARLFISDSGNGNVYLYDIPSFKLLTILQGFSSPQGECADNKGDVWLTDNLADTIYMLAYTGRTVKRISDTDNHPVGCAWDPSTGNLSVTNYVGTGSQSGSVAVYRHAQGSPVTYRNPAQFYYDFAGFDDAGNVFFDGSNVHGGFVLSELPVKAKTPFTIKVSGATIYSAGMVQWDPASKYLDVGDQNCNETATSCLYQLQISGKEATVANEVPLKNYAGTAICDLVQGVVAGGLIFGSDNDYCGYAASATYAWPYPEGGTANKDVRKNASQPIGAAIAVKPSDPRARGVSRPPGKLNPKNLDLMYVSEGDVAVYTYLQKTLVRKLKGFSDPQGECVDKKNDVYITDAGDDDIVEYAHDGNTPLRTIEDAPYIPYGCAVDFKSGNLAIANKGASGNGGSIAIFAKASGTPTILTDAHISNFFACTYDDQGNLLATGQQQSSDFGDDFAWLPAGGTRLDNISVPGPVSGFQWQGVIGLLWDGRYFVIQSDESDLLRVAIQSGEAYYIGQTTFEFSSGQEYRGWIYNSNPKHQGTQFVLPYSEPGGSSVDYYDYPSGGDSIGYLSLGTTTAAAVVISLGETHN